MKVETLIAHLSELPPETEIHFEGYDDSEEEEMLSQTIADYFEEGCIGVATSEIT